MKSLVGIDSNIFIWGIKNQASAGQEEMIERARNFIQWVQDKEWGILLPFPMLAEILSPVPVSEHQKILSLITKSFVLAPFDFPAATKCAELLNNSYTDAELKSYRETMQVPKQKMKYDCMIAAICIVKKVNCIYTTDGDIAKFAGSQMVVKDLPKIQPKFIQHNLFGTE